MCLKASSCFLQRFSAWRAGVRFHVVLMWVAIFSRYWLSRESPLSSCLVSLVPSSWLHLLLLHTQVSQSKEHQQFITFLQRLLGPLLEAYSSAAIFVHNFSGPVPEPEYLQKLHKYLVTRTERNVAVYGMLSHYLFFKIFFFDYRNFLIVENWKNANLSWPLPP